MLDSAAIFFIFRSCIRPSRSIRPSRQMGGGHICVTQESVKLSFECRINYDFLTSQEKGNVHMLISITHYSTLFGQDFFFSISIKDRTKLGIFLRVICDFINKNSQKWEKFWIFLRKPWSTSEIGNKDGIESVLFKEKNIYRTNVISTDLTWIEKHVRCTVLPLNVLSDQLWIRYPCFCF